MKKFKFSTEKVLKVREFKEENAKIELGKAVSESERLRNILEYIAVEQVNKEKSRSLAVNENGKIDILYLQSIEDYINALENQKERTLEMLAENELIVEQKRQAMIEAMQDRKVIEKLKEKKFAEYKKQIEKEEEKEADDNRKKNERQ